MDYIVSCRGVAQLGGLVGPTMVKAHKSFFLLKVPLKLKIKNTCLISLSHL